MSLNAQPSPGRVFLQFLAPYLGVSDHAYYAVPIAAGDFSFAYSDEDAH
ncbi:MAG: hypothetical protein ACYC5Q_03435 [Thermoleophilia bacterium]